MTDREMLELAAKAAGLTFDAGVHIQSGHLLVTDKDAGQPFFWNPITDDGDALRLAVKLELTVRVGVVGCADSTPVGDDPYAATRLAIVRAAAEIGRSME